jgi:uncharacterized protein YkwD
MRSNVAAAVLLVAGCSDSLDVPDCNDDQADETCSVYRIVNTERGNAGLDAYTWNIELALAAQRHAEDMVANGYFDHTSLDGRSFADRARDAGYDGSPRGENIAAGQPTPEDVMDAWMGSDGHRANILAAESDEIGVGLHELHWVQVFGARED